MLSLRVYFLLENQWDHGVLLKRLHFMRIRREKKAAPFVILFCLKLVQLLCYLFLTKNKFQLFSMFNNALLLTHRALYLTNEKRGVLCDVKWKAAVMHSSSLWQKCSIQLHFLEDKTKNRIIFSWSSVNVDVLASLISLSPFTFRDFERWQIKNLTMLFMWTISVKWN